MRKEVSEVIAWAEGIGFVNEGMDGSGHFRLRHSNGETYRVAATPSDRRAEANSKADMRRIAGVEHDGPKSGSYKRGLGRRKPVTHLASESELTAQREIRDLISEHRHCSDRLQLMQQGKVDNRVAARYILRLLAAERELADRGQMPPVRTFRIYAEEASA